MSTLKVNNLQVGQDSTATNNLTWFQPGSPDGSIRLGSGNAGSATTKFTFDKDGNLTCVGDINAASILAPIEGTLDDWIVHAGDTNTKFGFPAADTFQVETGGTNRLKIDANGVVQITRRLELTNSGDNHNVYEGRSWTWTSNGTSSGTVRAYMYGDSTGALRVGTGGWNQRLKILSGGIVLIGNDTSQEVYGTNAVQIQGTSGPTSSLSLLRHGNSPYLVLGSSGGSALNAVTALSADNRIGQITFAGADGTDINTHSASIAAYVDGSVSSNAVPGRLIFATSTGATETERLRITSGGRIDILGDGGNAGFTLSNAYGQAGFFGGMYYNGSSWTRNATGTRQGAGMYINTGGHIAFLTSTETSGTSATVTERLRIASDGKITVAANSDIRFTNGTWTGEVAGKIQHNSNNLYIQGGTGGIRFRHASNGSNQFSMTNGGNFEITNGDLVIGTGGHGISFINAADTATGETVTSSVLDEYEEGTWVPANQYLTITNNNTATYTKVGRLVTIQFDCTYASSPADTAQVGGIIQGLPFAGQANGYHFTPTWLNSGSVSDNESKNFLSYVEGTSNNRIIFYSVGNNCTAIRAQTAGQRVRGTVTYMASA